MLGGGRFTNRNTLPAVMASSMQSRGLDFDDDEGSSSGEGENDQTAADDKSRDLAMIGSSEAVRIGENGSQGENDENEDSDGKTEKNIELSRNIEDEDEDEEEGKNQQLSKLI